MPVAERDSDTVLVAPDAVPELAVLVGRNLRRLRTRQGYSLERLAKVSGVSRGMLSQIELGRSTPTIGLLWKIANALGVTFATLTSTTARGGTTVLRRNRSKVLTSNDGKFSSRALFPFDGERRIEFYELRIAPGHTEAAEPHSPGTLENLAVSAGTLELHDGLSWSRLEAGDSILFEADVDHLYRNAGTDEAVVYLVMTYVEAVG